jgi:hypothetical protein
MMTREEAEAYIWDVHNTYFIQRPTARTYTCSALYEYLTVLLPTEDERQDLYAALGIETCVCCRQEHGLPNGEDDWCPWHEACALVLAPSDTDAP